METIIAMKSHPRVSASHLIRLPTRFRRNKRRKACKARAKDLQIGVSGGTIAKEIHRPPDSRADIASLLESAYVMVRR